jgi:hypothetical protein
MKQIKLSTVSTQYETDNKTYVKCILKVKLREIHYRDYRDSVILPKFYGIAKLHKGDNFDYDKGCRIALAKAERIAYKKVGLIIDGMLKALKETVVMMEDFVGKSIMMVEHNSEYIKKLADN